MKLTSQFVNGPDFFPGPVNLFDQLTDFRLHPGLPASCIDGRGQKPLQQRGVTMRLLGSPLIELQIAPAECLCDVSQLSVTLRICVIGPGVNHIADRSDCKPIEIRQRHCIEGEPRVLLNNANTIEAGKLRTDGPGKQFEQIVMSLRQHDAGVDVDAEEVEPSRVSQRTQNLHRRLGACQFVFAARISATRARVRAKLWA